MSDQQRHGHTDEAFDSEIDVKRIGWFLVWLAVGSVVTCVLMYALYRDFQSREERTDRPGSPLVDRSQPRLPPEPRLQVMPEVDLQRYRTEQQTLLESYGWVDQAQGIAHIPIDRAIDLVAAQQLPWRPHQAVTPMLPGGIPPRSPGPAQPSTRPAQPAESPLPGPHAAPVPAHAPAPDPHSGGHP